MFPVGPGALLGPALVVELGATLGPEVCDWLGAVLVPDVLTGAAETVADPEFSVAAAVRTFGIDRTEGAVDWSMLVDGVEEETAIIADISATAAAADTDPLDTDGREPLAIVVETVVVVVVNTSH